MKDQKLEFLKRMREDMKKVYAGEKSVEEIKSMIRQGNGGSSEKETTRPSRNRGLVLIEEED